MSEASSQKVLCSIYRSPRKEGMYIYVLKKDGLDKVPEPLLKQMGSPGHVMDLLLTPDRKLARVDVLDVLRDLDDKGFYLQMPPAQGHPV